MSPAELTSAVLQVGLAHVRARLTAQSAGGWRRDAVECRARWMVLWACCAAVPGSRPADWASQLDLEATTALLIVGRLRTAVWWNERLIVEALVIMADAA